eukprot:6426664-Lingulodinium_polyedra.AAC.1
MCPGRGNLQDCQDVDALPALWQAKVPRVCDVCDGASVSGAHMSMRSYKHGEPHGASATPDT